MYNEQSNEEVNDGRPFVLMLVKYEYWIVLLQNSGFILILCWFVAAFQDYRLWLLQLGFNTLQQQN